MARKTSTPAVRVSATREQFHHGDLRASLVRRLLATLDAEGVGAISLRRLAREEGVDPSAVYRHFRDLDALWAEAAKQCFVQLADATEDAIEAAGRSAPARFRAAGRAYIDYALAHPERFRLMFGPLGSGPGALARAPGQGRAGRTAWDALTALVRELDEAGKVKGDVALAAESAWAVVHGLAALHIDGPFRGASSEELERRIQHALRTLERGIAT